MTIPSHATPEFWQLYRALPANIRALARKSYRVWSANAFHPSLHFKPIGGRNWSLRIGDHCRAVGRFTQNLFLWEWLGTHEEYNSRF